MPRVIVAGGGIAGLTAALTLQERGIDVTLVEAEQRYGGKLRTEHEDGFLIDAGPDSFLSMKPAALQLAARVGIAERVIDTRGDGGGTYILRAGTLQPLPEGITLLVPTELKSIARTPLLSPLGKARMSLDYVIPARKGTDDESVGSFVRRRLGREAFERMAEPLLSGIYAGDADSLSLAATFPRLRDAERTHGGMVRAALAQRRAPRPAGATPAHTPFISFDGGLGVLIDALQAALKSSDLRTNCTLRSLARQEDGWFVGLSDGTHVRADAVVLAISASAAATLIEPLSTPCATALREIPWVSSATVSLGFNERELGTPPNGRGFVIPRAEGRTLTAVTWTSNKFAGRTPPGQVLLRAFVGRAGNEAPALLPEDDLLQVVRRELTEILGIQAVPTLARVYRWPAALPQYTLGHLDRLTRIDTALTALPGLALTGASYRGIGIPDCISDAEQQAIRVADALAGTRDRQPMSAL